MKLRKIKLYPATVWKVQLHTEVPVVPPPFRGTGELGSSLSTHVSGITLVVFVTGGLVDHPGC